MAKCCVVFSQSPFEDLIAFRVRHFLLLVSTLTSNAPVQWPALTDFWNNRRKDAVPFVSKVHPSSPSRLSVHDPLSRPALTHIVKAIFIENCCLCKRIKPKMICDLDLIFGLAEHLVTMTLYTTLHFDHLVEMCHPDLTFEFWPIHLFGTWEYWSWMGYNWVKCKTYSTTQNLVKHYLFF